METVCKYNYIVKSDKTEYDPYEFSFEFIIAIAFRINSANARMLREWAIREIFCPKVVFFLLKK